ncbi:cell wall-associated hydrolase, invasion-associated protein [Actinoalloteichus hymeniacidonis]|uniref:Cell wall-associated hydrolase, invasion-associated protein n=2 Tax=Actinoalloteichus hymeniacidonis TaxID=340345 RepID=A0AAC9MY28_9PSEU|nr:cell wall-associated hydrolase, invasion-associated protein [Actinoalloteichus hymeniacidonis]
MLALLTVVGLLIGSAPSAAEPPAEPSDAQIERGNARVEDAATRVGELTNRMAELGTRRDELLAQVELAMEDANRALVDLETAEEVAQRAADAATTAQIEADAAAEQIARVRSELDDFAAASYQQGTMVGSLSAYFGAESPDDLLERAQLLDAVSGSHVDLLDELERARTEKVNKDSAARAALAEAETDEAAAAQAKSTADEALEAAIAAEQEQQAAITEVEAERSAVEEELSAAHSAVDGLESQRAQFEQWQRQQREEAEQVATAIHAEVSAPAPVHNAATTSGSIEVVIERAMAQLGVPYSWGGGTASGPTIGVRDGGVADAHGDYQKVGFDCSGLMVFAFAGAGVDLPKYSGYQYESGNRVPLAQMRRGDMIFWQTGGRIHHVALYLGDGMMVEAPYSGNQVRVTPVRYGGIAPYAVRML